MILADTSAWIEYLRATGSAVHLRLVELLAAERQIAVTDLVLMEVLAVLATPRTEIGCDGCSPAASTSRRTLLRTTNVPLACTGGAEQRASRSALFRTA